MDVLPTQSGVGGVSGSGGSVGGGLCTWTDNFWVINRYTRTCNISHRNWQSPVDGNDLCDRHGANQCSLQLSAVRFSYISYYGSTHETTLCLAPPPSQSLSDGSTIIHLGWHGVVKPARSKNCIAAKSSFKLVEFNTEKKIRCWYSA